MKSKNELKDLKTAILKKYAEFVNLKKEVNFLNEEDFNNSSKKTGIPLAVSNVAESLVNQILKISNIKFEDIAKKESNSNRLIEPSFDDCIKIAQNRNLLDKHIAEIFKEIKNKRNLVAHKSSFNSANENYYELTLNDARVLIDRLKSLWNWYFQEFLINKLDDATFQEIIKEKESLDRHLINNINSAEKSINEKFDLHKTNKKNNLTLYIASSIFIFIGITFFYLYKYFYVKADNNSDIVMNKSKIISTPSTAKPYSGIGSSSSNEINTSAINKSKVKEILQLYFESRFSRTFNPSNFFINTEVKIKLAQEYKSKSIFFDDIKNYFLSQIQFNQFNIDIFRGQLKYIGVKNGYHYWNYKGEIDVFEESLKLNFPEMIDINFSMNEENKILSIEENFISK